MWAFLPGSFHSFHGHEGLCLVDEQVGCVAGRGPVVDYARAWLGAGNGGVSTQNTRGHSRGQRRSDYTKPAAEFPHIRSSLQTASRSRKLWRRSLSVLEWTPGY